MPQPLSGFWSLLWTAGRHPVPTMQAPGGRGDELQGSREGAHPNPTLTLTLTLTRWAAQRLSTCCTSMTPARPFSSCQLYTRPALGMRWYSCLGIGWHELGHRASYTELGPHTKARC